MCDDVSLQKTKIFSFFFFLKIFFQKKKVGGKGDIFRVLIFEMENDSFQFTV